MKYSDAQLRALATRIASAAKLSDITAAGIENLAAAEDMTLSKSEVASILQTATRCAETSRLDRAERLSLGHGFSKYSASYTVAQMDNYNKDYVRMENRPGDHYQGHIFGDRLEKPMDTLQRDLTAPAALTLGSAGSLPVDVADRFIDHVREQTPTLGAIAVRRLLSPTFVLDELTVKTRQLRLGVEATAPTKTNPSAVRRRGATVAESILPEDITLSFLEDNIERQGAEQHVASALTRQYGSDMNDLAWNGDVADAGGDADFLNIHEGFNKLITTIGLGTAIGEVRTATIAAGSVLTAFRAMRNGMDQQYRLLPDLALFVPVDVADLYGDHLANRETGLGDSVIVNGRAALAWNGIPIIADPHMPNKMLFGPRSNMTWGVHRAIRVDGEYRPRTRVVEYTITSRENVQIATPEAMVYTATLPALTSAPS
ncbi:MAG: phage major capsid protein [Gammaproteobacteria bacterium]|nr:phage major capsid protein [Gammaproteobacteria bacterium]